ncbi:MAG: serine/threonine protein kinase [Deltaproteobacteria bacterium]|nr:serine/threonine protein kinase [Deltaproteobacteria bacterium]
MNSMPPPIHQPGELLDGRYRLGEVLGRGGHGIVYQAVDEQAGIDVAIKFLHPEFASDPEFNVRMLREAQVASKLQGTASIQIFALRSDKSGALFIVMELLEGNDLSHYLALWEEKGLFFPVSEVPKIFAPIVHTLAAAHAMGIAHRDLKPGNLYVMSPRRGGHVRLLDFGLAKVMSANPLTRAGMVAGSPSYIAPEVWRGDPTKLDHRIDVYSLGALIFRVMAGQPPFSGSLIELMQASLTAKRPSLHAIRPDEIPPDVDPWVQKALAIDPNQRYQNVTELWRELKAAMKW